MAFVLCETKPGLRDSEAAVAVRDINGRAQRLRVERDFLRVESGREYLPVGVVARHPELDQILIELPLEADSGANRMWVRPDDLLQEVTVS